MPQEALRASAQNHSIFSEHRGTQIVCGIVLGALDPPGKDEYQLGFSRLNTPESSS